MQMAANGRLSLYLPPTPPSLSSAAVFQSAGTECKAVCALTYVRARGVCRSVCVSALVSVVNLFFFALMMELEPLNYVTSSNCDTAVCYVSLTRVGVTVEHKRASGNSCSSNLFAPKTRFVFRTLQTKRTNSQTSFLLPDLNTTVAEITPRMISGYFVFLASAVFSLFRNQSLKVLFPLPTFRCP